MQSITSILARLNDGQISTRAAKKLIAVKLRKEGNSIDAIRWVLSRRGITQVTPPYNRFTARYMQQAAHRLTTEETTPTREFAYFRAHKRANAHRKRNAKRLHADQVRYGPLLGWYSVLDARTTPECAYRSGKNFSVLYPPRGELPGVHTHYGCRCHSGPPHKDAPTLKGHHRVVLPR